MFNKQETPNISISNSDKKVELRKLSEEMAVLGDIKENLLSEINKYKNQKEAVSDLSGVIATLSDDIKSLELKKLELEKIEKLINSNNEKLSLIKDEIKEKNKEVKEVNANLSEIKEAIITTTSLFNVDKLKLENELNNLSSEVNNLSSEKLVLKKDIKALSEKSKDLSVLIASFESNLAVIEKNINIKETELLKLIQEKTKKEEEFATLIDVKENEASLIVKMANDSAEEIVSKASSKAKEIEDALVVREANVSEREQWLKNKTEILKTMKLELETFYNKKIPNLVIE